MFDLESISTRFPKQGFQEDFPIGLLKLEELSHYVRSEFHQFLNKKTEDIANHSELITLRKSMENC